MPDPFLVIATQNPIEYEGTFAPRGAARPLHDPPPARLPAADRGDRSSMSRSGRTRSRSWRRSSRPKSCARCRPTSARSTSTRRCPTTSSAWSTGRGPIRTCTRRLAARLDRAVPRRPCARRAARPRLRDPRRHQGARRARAGPPAHHQDELVDPRRQAAQVIRELLEATAVDGVRPTGVGGPREIRSTSGAGRARASASSHRRPSGSVAGPTPPAPRHRRRSSSPRFRPASRSSSTCCTPRSS